MTYASPIAQSAPASELAPSSELTRHLAVEPTRLAPRPSAIDAIGTPGAVINWLAIGDEIADLLAPDPAYLTH
jgi:hypothetical protein